MTVATVAKNEYFEQQSVQCMLQMTTKFLLKRHIIVYIIVLMIINSHRDHGTNFMNVPKAVLMDHHICNLLDNIRWGRGVSAASHCATSAVPM